MEEPKYQITKNWDNALAKNYYQLWRFKPYSENHSCYSCYDAWKKHRKECLNNGPMWEPVPNATGDAAWAKRTAKHYGAELPK